MSLSNKGCSGRMGSSLTVLHGFAAFLFLGVLCPLVDAQQFIYWAGTGNEVRRADPTNIVGTKQDVFTLSTAALNTFKVLQSAGKLYWSDNDGGHLFRSNLDGSSVQTIMTAPQFYRGFFCLAIDQVAQRLYFGLPPNDNEQDPGLVGYSNVDGGAPHIVSNPTGELMSIDVDHQGGKVWWLTSARQIQSANLDLSNVQTVVSSGINTQSHSLAVDPVNGKVFYADATRIGRVNMDGTQLQLFNGTPNGWELTVDPAAQQIYWIETPKKIWRSNLDGTGLLNILTDSNQVGDSFLGVMTLGPAPAVPTVSIWSLTAFGLLILAAGTLVLRFKLESSRVGRQAAS